MLFIMVILIKYNQDCLLGKYKKKKKFMNQKFFLQMIIMKENSYAQ